MPWYIRFKYLIGMMVIALGAIGYFLFSLWVKPSNWDCFVFPDRYDLFQYQNVGTYETLEACRQAGQEELKRLHTDQGYYQCGQDCLSKSGLKTVVACKKIVR